MSFKNLFLSGFVGVGVGLILGILVLTGILIPPRAAATGLVFAILFIVFNWMMSNLEKTIKPATWFIVGMSAGVLLTEYAVKATIIGVFALITHFLSRA